MANSRGFWLAMNLAVLLVYALGGWMALQGQPDHWLSLLAAITLALHLLELPLAWMQLREQNPALLRWLLMTLIFGLTWWVPAKNGLYRVR